MMRLHLVVAAAITAVHAGAALAAGPERLPDGEVSAGTRDIVRAWLIHPTGRYRHGVLGDAIEAGGLAVRTRDGRLVTLETGKDTVYEDRKIRLADLDGDGRDEMIVVQAHAAKGAALAVYRIGNGRIEPVARTPWIGRAHRWLNPAAIADFDGDGRPDIAIVVTPHLAGRLQFWTLSAGRLILLGEQAGYSNHVIGERALDRALVVPIGGNRSGLVIATLGHDELVLLELKAGEVREIARHDTKGRLAPSFSLAGEGRVVRYRLQSGQAGEWRRPD